MNKLKLYLFQCRYELRNAISNYPFVYIPLVSLTNRRHQLVNDNTDILIEGFPRCGNSFAVEAFRMAQKKECVIATHLHSSAHILYSLKRNIPIIVTIRNPIDSVVSYIVFSKQIYLLENKTPLYPTINQLFRSYITFYDSIIEHKEKFVIAKFDQITSDFGLIIKNVNKLYNTNFEIFEHKKEIANTVLDNAGLHAGPSSSRTDYKEEIYSIINNPSYEKILSKATNLYEEFVG